MVVAGVRTITNAAAWPSIHPNPAQILRSVQIHLNWYRPTQNRFLPIQISNQKMPLLCTVTIKRKKKHMAQKTNIIHFHFVWLIHQIIKYALCDKGYQGLMDLSHEPRKVENII